MDQQEALEHFSALSEIAQREEELKKSSKSVHMIPNFDISMKSMRANVAELFESRNKGKSDDTKKTLTPDQIQVTREPLNIRVVMISDTHADHGSLTIPDGDILIHAGDWTCYGHREHAEDFNEWLGTLPHPHKIVVNGNHENNSTWKRETPTILSNCTFLCQNSVKLLIRDQEVNIFGTDFFWPTTNAPHPFLDHIPTDTDILITHGPPFGFTDGGRGCEFLQKKCLELAYGSEAGGGGGGAGGGGRLRLVVCGHLHYAYGVDKSLQGLTVVNASSCGENRCAVHDPIVLDL